MNKEGKTAEHYLSPVASEHALDANLTHPFYPLPRHPIFAISTYGFVRRVAGLAFR